MSDPSASTSPVAELAELGCAPWLDSISRTWLDSGELASMRDRYDLRGVTSNPAIFQQALTSDAYDEDIAVLADEGLDARQIFHRLAIDDIRRACDCFADVHEQTGDGFVSIEVDPDLAEDAEETIRQATWLWNRIDRPNLMIKVPGTTAGLTAVEHLLGDGINVNVTLLFGVERYREVMEHWLTALERRQRDGLAPASVASVASFFVSRVDTKVDQRLPEGSALRGRVAVANAVIAWEAHRSLLSGSRWQALEAAGASPQRPLWASTGTKDPAYSDVLYVEELVVPGSVNTMPLATIEAFHDHGSARVRVDETAVEQARATLAELAEQGIDLHELTEELLAEGLAAFVSSFESLLEGIESKRLALSR